MSDLETNITNFNINSIIKNFKNLNDIILELNNNNINILKNLEKIQIKYLLYILDYYYHIKGESLIKDNIYDKIINEYHDLQTVLFDTKIKLPYSMPGIKKYYPDNSKQIIKSLSKFCSSNIIISSKLDGISCLLVKKKNKINLYTKGTNNEGRDITYILDYINFNKEHLNNVKNIALRGELIIQKKYYKDLKITTSLRSQVVKFIHQKKIEIESLKYIDLVIYEIKSPKYSFNNQFLMLNDYKINTVKNIQVDFTTVGNIVAYLLKIYNNFLDEDIYDIDGLIVTESNNVYDIEDNNLYQFAFKNNTIFGISEVIHIQWSISKDFRCIPVILIKPIVLDNITVNKVSGFNASFIINNKIGIGAKIKIRYSGKVIPVVDSVITPSDNIVLPKINYKWDDNKVHFITSENYNLESVSKQLEKYYIVFDIKHFGNQSIYNVIKKISINTIVIKDIFDYIDVLNNWDRSEKILGTKKDLELFESLLIFKNKPISIILLLLATNKFYLMDEIKLTTIFRNNQYLIDILTKKTPLENLNEDLLLETHGIGKKSVSSFMAGLKYFIEYYDNFNKYFNINYNIILENKLLKIVFSNVTNKQKIYINKYRDYFTEFLNVTKSNNINYVVTSSLNTAYTEKMNKAIKYNIPIITINDFIEKIKILKDNIN